MHFVRMGHIRNPCFDTGDWRYEVHVSWFSLQQIIQNGLKHNLPTCCIKIMLMLNLISLRPSMVIFALSPSPMIQKS